MKRWHRSMKRKPRVGEDILIIWKDKNITNVTIDTMLSDEYGESYLCCSHDSYDWDFVAPMIKQWAYVDEYFEKELNNDAPTISSYDRKRLAEKLGSQPSSGFMVIDLCLTAHAKSIQLYGFDFEQTPTFYNPDGYKTKHDYNKEQEIVLEYERAGLLTINKGE